MKRLLKLSLIACCVALTGCTSINFGVDGLITAPKLTQEQSEIHQALVSAVGGNINLKYPKDGNNRSAYVIKNIDNEPGDEALVFYEYTGAEKKEGLKVNVLDKNDDDKWYSVKEFAGIGSEVSRVIISDMGNNSQTDIVIGYANPTGDEKSLEVYSYSNGEIKTIGKANYSLLESYDINNDGIDELLVISKNKNKLNKKKSFSYIASLLEVQDNELIKTSSIEMLNNVASYVNVVKGKIGDTTPAFFIDELNNENELQTEILYLKDDTLRTPDKCVELLPVCTRITGYYSQDFDGGGAVEIPSVKTMIGYENAIEEEKLYLTEWYAFEDENQYSKKYSGYYSISDGFVMTFPARWDGQVTVKTDLQSQETVFYKYNGDINGKMTELMRIAVASDDDKSSYLYNGYKIISKNGRINYLVKLSNDKEEPLIPTIDEVENSFFVVG